MKGVHFLADWTNVVFIHFETPPEELSPEVPFELDLREGSACVSLVAFTLSKMRLSACPALTLQLLRPLSEHQFLNVRTYVKVRESRGIYFLAEWLNCAAAVPLGGFSYGLPYRYGHIDYEHKHPKALHGCVCEGGDFLRYDGKAEPVMAADDFLLERYEAFTEWRGCRRGFRIEHAPWAVNPADIVVTHDSLLRRTGAWADRAGHFAAHYSPGVRDVAMGFPKVLS